MDSEDGEMDTEREREERERGGQMVWERLFLFHCPLFFLHPLLHACEYSESTLFYD